MLLDALAFSASKVAAVLPLTGVVVLMTGQRAAAT